MDFFKRAKEIENEMKENRKYIHRFPEINDDLPRTTKFVIDKLKDMGYNPKEICKCGIVATVGKGGRKTILLRADMDALNMKEQSGLEFCSENDYAHTCGHDIHTAVLLGVAKLLKENENDLYGTVKLMFQPAEEPVTGAKAMIDAGLMENPHVDAAMAMHINAADLPTGVIGYTIGETYAAATKFRITVNGTASHGAMPQNSADPINSATHIYLALQELLAREIGPLENAVVTIGMFQAGTAGNAIPDKAVMEGTIRAYKDDIKEFIKKRIIEISTLTAKAFRTECEIEYFSSVPAIINDEKLTKEFVGYIKNEIGENNVVPYRKLMISEDFSYLSQLVPSTFLALGAGSKEEGYIYGLHNPKVLFNEDSMTVACAAFVKCAVEYLKNN